LGHKRVSLWRNPISELYPVDVFVLARAEEIEDYSNCFVVLSETERVYLL
jgi:hypothetical protein